MKRTLLLLLLLGLLLLLPGCKKTPVPGPGPEGTDPAVTAAPVVKEGLLELTFSSSDPTRGTVSGSLKQTLESGKDKCKKVEAKAELGYKFVRWSDGSTDPVRENEIFTNDAPVYAVFDYDVLDLPIIAITTETGGDVTSKTEYIDGDMSIFNTGERPSLSNASIQIRGRGNNTWTYEKKSYKIKLDKKENLLGCAAGKGKTWVLLANMCDQSLLRNRTCLALGNALKNIIYEPHTFPVEVYLNGEYRGCYLLAEEINVDDDRVNVDEDVEDGTDIGYLVELSIYAEGENIFYAHDKKYQVRSDLSESKSLAKKQLAYIQSYIDNAMKTILRGDEDEIREVVDVDSFIDAYILEEVAKNLDMGWDSFYLTKDKGGKLALGPCWDFDLTLGNGNITCEFYTDIYVGILTEPNLSNPWFYQMMKLKWFRQAVLERWDEFLPTLRTFPDYVLNEGTNGYRSYCRNFEKWQIFGQSLNRETELITSLRSYDEHYHYLAQWLSDRIDWLDACYHSKEYQNGVYIVRDSKLSNEATETAEKIYDELEDVTRRVKNLTGDGQHFGDEKVGNLLDSNTATKYCCQTNGTLTMRFKMSEPTAIRGIVVTTGNDTENDPNRNPVRWTLYGSNVEHGDWTVVSQVSDAGARLPIANEEYAGFLTGFNKKFTYYKWVLELNGTIFQFSEIEFFE